MAEGTSKTASRVSAPTIEARKGDGTPVVMVTAYDAPSARIVDRAGVDIILVGDTLAMVVLGYDDTLQVTTDDMAHHVGAVARTQSPRARRRRPALAQLPRVDSDTVRNAAALVRAGAGAVKLEGGRKRLPAVQAILDAEIPVMGHLGLTPQSVHALGGFRVQGKDLEAARDASSTTRSRSPKPAASPSCSSACPTPSLGSSPTPCPSRRSGSVPAGTATARSSSSTTCSASRTA